MGNSTPVQEVEQGEGYQLLEVVERVLSAAGRCRGRAVLGFIGGDDRGHLARDRMTAQQEQWKADDVEGPPQQATKDLQGDDFSGSCGRLGERLQLRLLRCGGGINHGVSGMGSDREPLCFIQPHRETLAAMESRVM